MSGSTQTASSIHLPDGHKDKLPVQIVTMLKVIMLYDKFEKIFCTWSTHTREDRDVLVLCLKPSSIIDTTLIYTICMMYPFCIYGPILINDTMQIEFLKHSPDLTVSSNSLDNESWNSQFAITRQQKRKFDSRDDPAAQLSSSVTGDLKRTDLEDMKTKLVDAISATNTSRIQVQKTSNGIDSKGPWVSFDLVHCDRLNLDFLGKFQMSINNSSVKVTSRVVCYALGYSVLRLRFSDKLWCVF